MTDSPTVVERDDSWIGKTIVALVVIALLVVGAIWLVNSVGDDGLRDDVNVDVNRDGGGGGTDTDTNTDTGTDPGTDTQPSG